MGLGNCGVQRTPSGTLLPGTPPGPQHTQVTPMAPNFQLGKEPGKAWALVVAAPHTTQRNPRCQKAVDVRWCRIFASPLFKIPQQLNQEPLEGGMPSTNCRVGLFCLWRQSLKSQLPPFIFAQLKRGWPQLGGPLRLSVETYAILRPGNFGF